MVTHKILEERKLNQTQITQYNIEIMKRVINYHWSALDFDKKNIMKEFSVADFDYIEEVDMVGKNKKYGRKRMRDK